MLTHWTGSLTCLLGRLSDFASEAFLILGIGTAAAALATSLWMHDERHR
jgi:hypothetical protein